MLVNNFDIIFMFMAYYALIRISIQNYGLRSMELFDLCILIWAVLSLVIKADQTVVLRDFAINLVFPIFILGIIITRYITETIFLQSNLFKPLRWLMFEKESYPEGYINSYFKDHLLTFVPIFCYSVAQTIRSRKGNSAVSSALGKIGFKSLATKKGHLGFLSLGLKLIGQFIVDFSRYIAIFVGIASSLVSISLPNSVSLLLSLFLLAVKKYDKHIWKFYMYYSICICLLMYANHKVPSSIESFNVEVLAMIGLTKSKELCNILVI